MRWAVESGYEYIWIMDDDTLPEPSALEKLLEADRVLGGPANCGFLSSVVLWTDGHHYRDITHPGEQTERDSHGTGGCNAFGGVGKTTNVPVRFLNRPSWSAHRS